MEISYGSLQLLYQLASQQPALLAPHVREFSLSSADPLPLSKMRLQVRHNPLTLTLICILTLILTLILSPSTSSHQQAESTGMTQTLAYPAPHLHHAPHQPQPYSSP